MVHNFLSQEMNFSLVFSSILYLCITHINKFKWKLYKQMFKFVYGELKDFMNFIRAWLEILFGGKIAQQILHLPLNRLSYILQIGSVRNYYYNKVYMLLTYVLALNSVDLLLEIVFIVLCIRTLNSLYLISYIIFNFPSHHTLII